MYCIGKVSEMVLGYNIIDKRNYDKFKASVLDLATEMCNESHRGYENIDEATNTLIDNFCNDAYLVLINKSTLKELKDTWGKVNSAVCSFKK